MSGSQYQCCIKTQWIFWTGILIITPYSWEPLYSDLADWRRTGMKEGKIKDILAESSMKLYKKSKKILST